MFVLDGDEIEHKNNSILFFLVGGSTLFIETAVVAKSDVKKTDGGGGGTARLDLTGQLGDVMKESCRIAYTFSKVCIKYLLANSFSGFIAILGVL